MPDRRPLPLVTADGPVCQEACTYRHIGESSGLTLCLANGGRPLYGTECLPSLREAWLREQRRKLEVCGMCSNYGRHDVCNPNLVDCAFNTTLTPWKPDESCSRFEERKETTDGT